MPAWKDDADLFAQARRDLFTAVVGDIMDKAGLRHQFLPPQIRPLDRGMITVGRAMTVLEADCFEEGGFGLMLEALDSLKRDEIYVCTGASPRYALWGELMSTRAVSCGAVGAVLDGYTRDSRAILAMNFPTFAYGSYAQDQGPRGKVIDFRVPIEMDGVRIEPGDVLFGDIDGVCVVPAKAVEEVFTGAFDKARKEKVARRDLEAGMTARATFDKYGIL